METCPITSNNADHFLCKRAEWVNFLPTWYYAYNNGQGDQSWAVLQPHASDIVIAELDFDHDTVTGLQGTNTTIYLVPKGYASGNLAFTANQWNGQSNPGEFFAGSASFVPNKQITVEQCYHANGELIAMGENGTLRFILTDHLGSTVAVTNWDGALHSRLRRGARR
jgi:hypothetical protein